MGQIFYRTCRIYLADQSVLHFITTKDSHPTLTVHIEIDQQVFTNALSLFNRCAMCLFGHDL